MRVIRLVAPEARPCRMPHERRSSPRSPSRLPGLSTSELRRENRWRSDDVETFRAVEDDVDAATPVDGRVEEWRGGVQGRRRQGRATPFVAALAEKPIAPFPLPAHRTGHDHLGHPAL